MYGNPKIASFCEIFLFQEWVFVCLHSISDSWLSLFLSPTNIFNVLLNFPFNSQTMNLFIFRNSTGEHNQTRVVHKISRYFSQYMEKAPTPLRRRGKILCVSYGPDSSVTQRSTVMRKLRKSTTALRLSHKSK